MTVYLVGDGTVRLGQRVWRAVSPDGMELLIFDDSSYGLTAADLARQQGWTVEETTWDDAVLEGKNVQVSGRGRWQVMGWVGNRFSEPDSSGAPVIRLP
jgi:hypothetical protein